jgi:integrase
MRRPGIYGPYKHRRKWRLVVVDEGGESTPVSYETKEAADTAKGDAQKQEAAESGVRVDQAIDKYESWQKARGLKENTYETARQRLDKFLSPVASQPLAMLTERKAKSIYADWVLRVPVATHQGLLGEAKMWANYCVAQAWIKRNPFAAVKGIGKKKKGKPQLRFDEARKWYATAYALAETEVGAIAAMATFIFGLRASEVAQLAVRDLDDSGRLLWVADGEIKTEAGKRTLEVPDDMRPLLHRLAAGKGATDPLFGPGRTRYWVYYWVQRVCALARVKKVCAHSMRGLHGSTAVEAGATPKLVSAALGHASLAVTENHYLAPGTTARATQRAALSVLAGGKK